jgi:hypothetical protein
MVCAVHGLGMAGLVWAWDGLSMGLAEHERAMYWAGLAVGLAAVGWAGNCMG